MPIFQEGTNGKKSFRNIDIARQMWHEKLNTRWLPPKGFQTEKVFLVFIFQKNFWMNLLQNKSYRSSKNAENIAARREGVNVRIQHFYELDKVADYAKQRSFHIVIPDIQANPNIHEGDDCPLATKKLQAIAEIQ